MNQHQKIAIEFCRECLGWEDVRPTFIPSMGNLIERDPKRNPTESAGEFLSYQDLANVLRKAADWCGKVKITSVGLEYSPVTKNFYVSVKLGRSDYVLDGCESINDLPKLIMECCIEGNRRLKAKAVRSEP